MSDDYMHRQGAPGIVSMYEVVLVSFWFISLALGTCYLLPRVLETEGQLYAMVQFAQVVVPVPFLLYLAVRRHMLGHIGRRFCNIQNFALFGSWLVSVPYAVNASFSLTMVIVTASVFLVAVMYTTLVSPEAMRLGLAGAASVTVALLSADAFLLQGLTIAPQSGYGIILRSTEYLACAGLAFCWRAPIPRYSTACLSIILLLVSGRRAALVGLPLVVAFHVISLLRHPSGLHLRSRVLVVVLAALLTGVFLSEEISQFVNEVFAMDDPYRGAGSGFTGRVELWQAGWLTFERHPVCGVGFRCHQMTDGLEDIHNGYIAYLVETGIVGVLPAVVMIAIAAWASLRNLHRRLDRALMGTAVGYFGWVLFERFLFNAGNVLSCMFILWLVYASEAAFGSQEPAQESTAMWRGYPGVRNRFRPADGIGEIPTT